MRLSRWVERVLAVGIGVAAGLMLGSQDEPLPSSEVELARPDAVPSSPPRLLSAEAPEVARGPAPPSAVEGGRTSVPKPEPVASQRGVRVTARTAEGVTVDEGTVYALPARDPGTDDAREIPYAGVADVLVLEGEGPWDIGVVHGTLHGLALDVVVPPGETVEVPLVLPPAKPIGLRVVGAAPKVERASVRAHVRVTAMGGVRRALPGRGEALAVFLGLDVPERGADTPPLPPGRYAVSAAASVQRWGARPGEDAAERHGLALDARPSEAEPGDRVDLVWLEGGSLRVLLRSTGIAWPHVPVTFTIRLEDGSRTEEREVEDDGQRLTTYNPRPIDFTVTSGRGRVSVEGRGVASETIEVDVRRGERVERELGLRFDGSTTLVSPMPVEIRVDGLPDDSILGWRGLSFRAALPEGRESLSRDGRSYLEDSAHRDETGRVTLPPVWREVEVMVGEVGNDLASDPTRVPRIGPVRVVMRPAGLVVVVPRTVPTESAGTMTLRHADGRPLGSTSSSRSATEVTVEPGTVLGPLPAGPHRFHVRIGRRPLPDAEVDVEAGRIVPLRLGE